MLGHNQFGQVSPVEENIKIKMNIFITNFVSLYCTTTAGLLVCWDGEQEVTQFVQNDGKMDAVVNVEVKNNAYITSFDVYTETISHICYVHEPPDSIRRVKVIIKV